MVLNQWGSSDISRSKAAKLRLRAKSTIPGALSRSMRRVRAGSPLSSWATEVRYKKLARAIQITK